MQECFNIKFNVLKKTHSSSQYFSHQYVEFNIEALLHTEDPEGLQRARGRILLTSEVQDTNSDNLNSEGGCKKENDNDSDNSPIAKGNVNDDSLL